MQISQKLKVFDVDFIGLILVGGLCAAAGLLLVDPLKQKILQTQEQRQKYDSDAQAAQSELTGLQHLVDRQEMLTQRLNQTKDVLHENTDMDEVIRRLSQLADSCKLHINEIAPGETHSAAHYKKTELDLKMGGTFPTLRAFIEVLRTELPFIRITSFSMRLVNQSDSGLCRIKMSLQVLSPVWK